MDIDGFAIGKRRVFVIAEIGNNHNGCIRAAKQLVDCAKEAGADCVKFQMRSPNVVYRPVGGGNAEDLGVEYIKDLLARFELTLDQQDELRAYCESVGIMYLCTPWDQVSLDILDGWGVPAFKVASADFSNYPLIKAIVQKKKPLILSTGMSTETEIDQTITFLNELNADFALLHCNSSYPAALGDLNLRYILRLQKKHDIVGYSGHEREICSTIAAVALGAVIVERHITLDRNMEGPDHAASLSKDDFRQMVTQIRQVELALGKGTDRSISQGEMINRENLGKSLVAARHIDEGDEITEADVLVRSPGQGLPPSKLDKLIGKKSSRTIDQYDFFYESDLKGGRTRPLTYNFPRPWGIPVRFHDATAFRQIIAPDLFEFHLSYSDLDVDLSSVENLAGEERFVVHSPELFAGSRLLDLATMDDSYHSKSVSDLKRVIDMALRLRKYFPSESTPRIVVNAGGWSMDREIPIDQTPALLEKMGMTLSNLNQLGCELIVQNMAPFPWHFGGQRYQNLLVSPLEIREFCERYNIGLCLDISHAGMACANFGWDLSAYIDEVGSVVSHLHLADASGVNGEGIQIGDGDLDFKMICQKLSASCPKASFIPEIWQGHKDMGSGFWNGLSRLQQYWLEV